MNKLQYLIKLKKCYLFSKLTQNDFYIKKHEKASLGSKFIEDEVVQSPL